MGKENHVTLERQPFNLPPKYSSFHLHKRISLTVSLTAELMQKLLVLVDYL